ncbi:hypothetical protein J1614_001558 [Plenodomus biglobosus]|nr:hypothetical protein J1614_001558 [Plenodomus biglobosus]
MTLRITDWLVGQFAPPPPKIQTRIIVIKDLWYILASQAADNKILVAVFEGIDSTGSFGYAPLTPLELIMEQAARRYRPITGSRARSNRRFNANGEGLYILDTDVETDMDV